MKVVDGVMNIKEEEEWIPIANRNKFTAKVRKRLRGRHKDKLQSLTLKGNPFKTLEDNPISNFFIGQAAAPMCDNFARFAIRARAGTLATRQTIAMSNNNRTSNKCPICSSNLVDTQAHILNGCVARFSKYTERHNYIVEELAAAITKQNKDAILHRSTAILKEADILHEEDKQIARRKPDIWFEHNDKFHIIEVTVPYDQISDHNETNQPINTLISRRTQKQKKYKELAELIKKTTNKDSEVYVIIVSSVGGVPPKTIKDLSKLLKGDKKLVNLSAKRMVVDTLKGSYLIYRGVDINLIRKFAPRCTIHEEEVSDYRVIQEEENLETEDMQILEETNTLDAVLELPDEDDSELLKITEESEAVTDSPTDDDTEDNEEIEKKQDKQGEYDERVAEERLSNQSRFRRGRPCRRGGRGSRR